MTSSQAHQSTGLALDLLEGGRDHSDGMTSSTWNAMIIYQMRAIITFQGFTESSSRRTGTEDLYFSVIRRFASEEITTYQPQPWTTNVEIIARQLSRQGIRNAAVISYSHGQAAACDFAKIAYNLGISVDLWLACDPVYRPSWLPRLNLLQPFALRALLPHATIKVPANIRRVAGVCQNISTPAGHELKAKGETIIAPLKTIPFIHTQIDSAGAWWDMVEDELRGWAKPPKATP
jgi:hypothetical protein